MNSNSSTQLSTQLLGIMQKQLDLVANYNEYLNQIKMTITQGDAEELNQLIFQPPVDIRQIEEHRLQQAQLLSHHGYEADEKGLQDCVKECDQPALKKLHTSLIDQIRRLEKGLLINDLLIRKNQHRIRQTLQILSGHGISDKAVTYSREGNTSQQGDNKHCIALV